jgi:hypothetical protein
MKESDKPRYIEPSQEAGRSFLSRRIEGSVVMLNLLRFREVADYSATPKLAPPAPITGEEAYELYIEHTQPFLRDSDTGLRHLMIPGSYRWPKTESGPILLRIVNRSAPVALCQDLTPSPRARSLRYSRRSSRGSRR